jgi:hypothetical protein
MAKDSEIVLLSDTYKLTEITSPESRDQLVSTLRALDGRKLTDLELRKYFDTLKIAMGAFIQKVSILEANIYDLRREQRAAEARMESMYLKAQLEIQSLKQEITEIRLSKGRINQIVKVAEALQGNAYAPYAIKSLVDGVVGQSQDKTSTKQSIKLPVDYPARLEFAQHNGFKWNQNNREPAKDYKKLEVLEEWEDQFCRIEKLSIEQILDKRYISKLGAGAIAGALMYLERELGQTLEARKSLSVFNCYQKAIKLYQQKQLEEATPPTNQPTIGFDFNGLVSASFVHISEEDCSSLIKRLETRDLSTAPQGISCLKKLISKKILPTAIKYDEEHATDSAKLYAIQSGHYDDQLLELFNRYELSRQ